MIAADFRKGKDEREAGKLKLLAGLFGVGLDDLVQRERVAARWRLRAALALSGAMVALAGAASWFGWVANVQRGVAEAQLQVSRAQRLAGDAQLEYSRASEAQRLTFDRDPAYREEDSVVDRSAERTLLMSLESLNTAQTPEGEQTLRWALSAMWPYDVVRALMSPDGGALAGWGPDGQSLILTDENSAFAALDLRSRPALVRLARSSRLIGAPPRGAALFGYYARAPGSAGA